MKYLVSRKRIVRMEYDADSDMYKNILDEFRKFINETDAVACYDNDEYHKGLEFINFLRKHMNIQMFEKYAKQIYRFIEMDNQFNDGIENMSIVHTYIPKTISHDMIHGFDKVLKCEIMYEFYTYIRFIIEDIKTEAPSVFEKYSITNRNNSRRVDDAKEIIKLLLWDLKNKNSDPTKDIEKAEQFLKDDE
jgi:hypothetical protein